MWVRIPLPPEKPLTPLHGHSVLSASELFVGCSILQLEKQMFLKEKIKGIGAWFNFENR